MKISPVTCDASQVDGRHAGWEHSPETRHKEIERVVPGLSWVKHHGVQRTAIRLWYVEGVCFVGSIDEWVYIV